MILIITHKQDYTADFVIDKLNKRQILYKRLNCEDINRQNVFSLESNSDKTIINLLGENSFNSVWYRRRMLPNIPESVSESERDYLLGEYRSLLENIFQSINSNWLSDPLMVERAENKLLQLRLAMSCGLLIPDTLVTQDKKQLKEFYQRFDGKVIIKPIANGRIVEKGNVNLIFTNRLKKEQIESLTEYDFTPCIYQKELEKKYELRITVVGKLVFAAKIESQMDDETKLDWRRKKMKAQEYELPKNIADMCIDLTRKLNISFGAIDIVRLVSGEYVFLEINPNGQWAWIEIDTGLPISDAIINFLNN